MLSARIIASANPELLMRSAVIISIGIIALLAPGCGRPPVEQPVPIRAAELPQLEPFVTDPAGTGAVRATWSRYAGIPDAGGVPQHALLLELREGARRGMEAGVRVTGLRGQSSPSEVGFDFQRGGTCTADGPRLIVTATNGEHFDFNCGAGKIIELPGEGRTRWTRVSFPMPGLPNGISVQDLRIVAVFSGPPSRILVGGFVGFKVEVGWPGLHVYAADPDHHRIVRIDNILTGGAFASLTTFGTMGSGVSQFNQPWDVDVDVYGHIYVADRMNDRIVRIDNMTGAGWQTAVGPGTCGNFSLPTQFCKPVGVFVDGLGRIYVREYYARTVRLDNMTGTGLTALGPVQQSNWGVFQDVFLDGAWRIYSSSPFEHKVDRVDDITGAGAQTLTMGCTGNSNTALCSPSGIFVDGSGRIYLADGCRIVRVNDTSGAGLVQFPTSQFCYAGGGMYNIGLDSYGRIYFTGGNGGLWRMNDMSGAGVVQVASFSSSTLGGIFVDDRGP